MAAAVAATCARFTDDELITPSTLPLERREPIDCVRGAGSSPGETWEPAPDMAGWAIAYSSFAWPVFPLWGLRPAPPGWQCSCSDGCPARWSCRCPAGATATRLASTRTSRRPTGSSTPPPTSSGSSGGGSGTAPATSGWLVASCSTYAMSTTPSFADGCRVLPAFTVSGPVVRTGAGKWDVYFAAVRAETQDPLRPALRLAGRRRLRRRPAIPPPPRGANEWLDFFDVELPTVPSSLWALVDPPPPPPPPPPPCTPGRTPPGRWNPQGLLDKMAAAVPGHRNDVLNRAALQFAEDVRAGKADQATADAALADSPPWRSAPGSVNARRRRRSAQPPEEARVAEEHAPLAGTVLGGAPSTNGDGAWPSSVLPEEFWGRRTLLAAIRETCRRPADHSIPARPVPRPRLPLGPVRRPVAGDHRQSSLAQPRRGRPRRDRHRQDQRRTGRPERRPRHAHHAGEVEYL